MEQNQYKNTAHLYDLDPRAILNDDIPFYLDRASGANGEILEVACGTGRVTLPLARAGYTVTGFDLSEEMIGQLNRKLSQEDQHVRERVTVLKEDMVHFEIGRRFPLILIPFRAFQLLTEKDEQIRFLDKVLEHLTEEGLFILNTYKPYGLLDESWVQPEKEDWVVDDLGSRTRVRRTHIRRSIDVKKQVNYLDLIYYSEDRQGNVHKFVEKLAMKYYYEEQLRNLLVSRGFCIKEELGYYDGRTMKEGPELIFVCSSRR